MYRVSYSCKNPVYDPVMRGEWKILQFAQLHRAGMQQYWNSFQVVIKHHIMSSPCQVPQRKVWLPKSNWQDFDDLKYMLPHQHLIPFPNNKTKKENRIWQRNWKGTSDDVSVANCSIYTLFIWSLSRKQSGLAWKSFVVFQVVILQSSVQ